MVDDLKQAVERLHECKASLQKVVIIHEDFNGKTVWEGSVSVFSVDHPDADICYAWSSPVEGSDRRKFYAVLHIPPVDSPEKAVRASIVADHKGLTNG